MKLTTQQGYPRAARSRPAKRPSARAQRNADYKAAFATGAVQADDSGPVLGSVARHKEMMASHFPTQPLGINGPEPRW